MRGEMMKVVERAATSCASICMDSFLPRSLANQPGSGTFERKIVILSFLVNLPEGGAGGTLLLVVMRNLPATQEGPTRFRSAQLGFAVVACSRFHKGM